jgi:pimeloyl-ACP methyl ester carboxylesterase
MTHRQHVRSIDGTAIGYISSGTGPPLVMVHGATADHSALSRVVPLLEPHFTVHAVDRRGRGLSGDGPSYDISLEYADVTAVVEDVARTSGKAVALYGHSYGAVCALGASRLTDNLDRLFLYEPGFRGVLLDPAPVVRQIDDLVSAGDHDAALELAYRAGVGMSAAEVAAMRALPTWSARVATVPTIPREFRTAAELAFDPSEHRALDLPTVLLLGERSTPGQKDVVARIDAALSHSRVVTLPGQAHAAQVTAPWLIADALLAHRRTTAAA